jgi:FlaA1/EpsC-like NDP-sugar epimerase
MMPRPGAPNRGPLLEGKRVIVTGGTGSLGQALVRRLLEGEMGLPAEVVVFSRSEALQHAMRLSFQHRRVATDDIVYDEARHQRLRFRVGDIRDYAAVCALLREADVVFHAAAMKQVPICEYQPIEAVKTNVLGAQNLVRAIEELRLPVEAVVGISTDKACKPVNVMGMTKALQERILIEADLHCEPTRFVVARYGNVIASRGSVVPLFQEQIEHGGPLTLTTPEMTRFLLTLDQAVDTVFAALRSGRRGETFVPRLPSARIVDLAEALMGDRKVEIEYIGIRPGEKVHEVLVSEEEAPRTHHRDDHLAIMPLLPELRAPDEEGPPLERREYSSADEVVDARQILELLGQHGVAGVGGDRASS